MDIQRGQTIPEGEWMLWPLCAAFAAEEVGGDKDWKEGAKIFLESRPRYISEPIQAFW
jgi:hypothetical protein